MIEFVDRSREYTIVGPFEIPRRIPFRSHLYFVFPAFLGARMATVLARSNKQAFEREKEKRIIITIAVCACVRLRLRACMQPESIDSSGSSVLVACQTARARFIWMVLSSRDWRWFCAFVGSPRFWLGPPSDSPLDIFGFLSSPSEQTVWALSGEGRMHVT